MEKAKQCLPSRSSMSSWCLHGGERWLKQGKFKEKHTLKKPQSSRFNTILMLSETILWIIHVSVEPQKSFYFLHVKWRISSSHRLSLWPYKRYAQAFCLVWNWASITPSQQTNMSLSSKHISQSLRSSLMHNSMSMWWLPVKRKGSNRFNGIIEILCPPGLSLCILGVALQKKTYWLCQMSHIK